MRILNNELGSALTKYKTNVVEYAQKEVNAQAEAKCKPMTAECRSGVIAQVARKYGDRERTYNMCVEIQNEAKVLLSKADAVCKIDNSSVCDEAKLNALVKDAAVKNAFEVVSPWIVQGKL
jgi:hypothetical protein